MSDTSNQPVARPSSGAFEELNRQIGTQAALVAGFAFAGLTVISYDPPKSGSLALVFSLACGATIAFELLAMCGSGKLTIMGKRHQFGERLDWHNMAAAYFNLAGLLAFVTAVILLVWIRFNPVRWIVVSIFALMLLCAIIWYLRLDRLERIAAADSDVGQNK
jgi:L-asparagine transporter-like permease